MDSLTFTPGRAFLSSNSPAPPWTAVFEDEGPAGYFYACDRSQETHEHSIMDAMLIYNATSLADPGKRAPRQRPMVPRRHAMRPLPRRHRPGLHRLRRPPSFCRSDFPNYIQEQGDTWRKSSHAWDDAAIQQFEAAIYA